VYVKATHHHTVIKPTKQTRKRKKKLSRRHMHKKTKNKKRRRKKKKRTRKGQHLLYQEDIPSRPESNSTHQLSISGCRVDELMVQPSTAKTKKHSKADVKHSTGKSTERHRKHHLTHTTHNTQHHTTIQHYAIQHHTTQYNATPHHTQLHNTLRPPLHRPCYPSPPHRAHAPVTHPVRYLPR